MTRLQRAAGRGLLVLVLTCLLLANGSSSFCSPFAPSKASHVSSSKSTARTVQLQQRQQPQSQSLPSSSRTTSLQAAFLPTPVDIDAIQSSATLLLADATATTSAAVVESSNDSSSMLSISDLLHIPTLWSILAMTSIVALLVAWEEAIENLRHNTPKPILPVIDSMLAEVGGLGFIGLFLSTVVTGGPLGQVIGQLSEDYLGDEELLLETFEFLHTFFFEVGIFFFAIAGVVVGAVLTEVRNLSEISELALDADGDGEVTLDELAEALNVKSMIVDADGDGIITEEEKIEALRESATCNKNFLQNIYDEYFTSTTDRAGEQLVIRAEMLEQLKLPQTFAIEEYFSKVFGKNLEEVVELSPATWLPLIPLIAIDNSVDLANDVVSAASSNAFDSCGEFFASPVVLYSTLFLQALTIVWAVFNFWKVSEIKKMLLPTLVKEHSETEAILLPPRYQDKFLLDQFNSSPSIFGAVEQLFSGGGSKTYPPRNAHEELFGASGAKFPSLFRESIQLHTWLTVTLIVYSTTQIIFRDAAALYINGGSGISNVGNPETILPELILWSAFVVSQFFQLSLSPTTFLNYCFVTSVEEFVQMDIVKKSFVTDEME